MNNHAPGPGSTRVLEILEEEGVPMTAQQVTTQARQKAGWATQYLDWLVAEGLVVRTQQHNGRWVYALPNPDDHNNWGAK